MGREDATWITCRCSPYHTNSVLYPIIEHLQRALRWRPEEPAGPRLDKLEQALCTSRLPCQSGAPAGCAAVGAVCGALRPPGPHAPAAEAADAGHPGGLAGGGGLSAGGAGSVGRPAAGGPTTLELLGLFVDQAPTASMLHVLTFRRPLCRLADALAPDATHPHRLNAPPGRGPDYTSGGWKVAAGGGRAAHCGQDRWRAAVCRRQ